MLKSLFGELGPAEDPRLRAATPDESDGGFAATAILESVATEVNDRGQMVDRHLRDLVVTGSPAQAIREHFATTRADLGTASRQITLLDPTGRVGLGRHQGAVRCRRPAGRAPAPARAHHAATLAVIERTTPGAPPRRHAEDLPRRRARPGRDNAEIPVALMERSHMTTVIVGPMQPHAIDSLLAVPAATPRSCRPGVARTCCSCCRPTRCGSPTRSARCVWPQRLHVHVLDEPLTSCVVGLERDARHLEPGQARSPPGSQQRRAGQRVDFPFKVAELSAPSSRPAAAAPPSSTQRTAAGAAQPRRARPGARQAGAVRHAAARRPARLRRRRRHHRPGAGA